MALAGQGALGHLQLGEQAGAAAGSQSAPNPTGIPSCSASAAGWSAVQPQVALGGPDQVGAGVFDLAELLAGQRRAVDQHGGRGEPLVVLDQPAELVLGALVVGLALGQVE
jgi:hypothetical protein